LSLFLILIPAVFDLQAKGNLKEIIGAVISVAGVSTFFLFK